MQQQGVAGYEAFGGVFFVIIALFSVLLPCYHHKRTNIIKGHVDQSTIRRPSVVDKDNRNVLDNIGQEPFLLLPKERESVVGRLPWLLWACRYGWSTHLCVLPSYLEVGLE